MNERLKKLQEIGQSVWVDSLSRDDIQNGNLQRMTDNEGQAPRAGRPLDLAGVLAAYAQLRLARAIVAEARLPWERPQRPRRLTPTRVLRGFAMIAPA